MPEVPEVPEVPKLAPGAALKRLADELSRLQVWSPKVETGSWVREPKAPIPEDDRPEFGSPEELEAWREAWAPETDVDDDTETEPPNTTLCNSGVLYTAV
jgi:hypothetical protein